MREKNILINVIQDRLNIENQELLKKYWFDFSKVWKYIKWVSNWNYNK